MKRLKVHYAWIILILTFLALLAAQGVRLSFGAFMAPWEHEFSANRSVISFIAFVSYIVFAISQPYVGRLIDKYGIRYILSCSILVIGFSTLLTFFTTNAVQLIIIYGVIASVGFGGASNVAGTMAVATWFADKKGMAMGLMSAGTAAGQLILVPLSLFLIDQLGWKTTVLVLGCFLIVFIFPLLLLFIRSNPADLHIEAYGARVSDNEKGRQKEAPKGTLSIFQLLKRKEFLFLMLPFFVCGVTTTGLMDTHLIPFAQYCGFTPGVTGAAVSLLAGFNILGTVVSGFLADRWNCRRILAFLYGVRALTIVLLLIIVNDASLFGFFVTQSHLLILFAISFGIVNFATVAPTMKLAAEYFRHLSAGAVIGWIYLSHQLGSALGSFVPGVIFDLTGSYDSSFIASIILLVLASALSIMLPRPGADYQYANSRELAENR
ncbi:MFS transporter [Cytobacillus pseudoceanisediminis]|uniref:MFS transporter n=3 Tax=Cytobacillus TaxID=2675230 RepID=A0A160M840_9BACI|nr:MULTISPECIES: MFS transporter [Cytobacillus]MBY0156535.1 MFS transporter [Cytobacillus firmus]AND38484.1 MFS transporter [Cytobacillus oceanisediminis 2691]MCM3391030.1 MFS transporter [Cytobacillus oceanisediminis]MCM3531094.1 MFS transporter [Cytobacillus oceanisediminis]OHX48002.1 MFS transporter [Cytobacillus oceanisediminis]